MGQRQLRGAAANRAEQIARKSIDARIGPGQITHRSHIAGFADEGEWPLLIEQLAEVNQWRRRTVARAGPLQHLAAVEAQMALRSHWLFFGGRHMKDEVDLTAFQQVDAQRRQRAARGRLETYLRIGGEAYG